jgi:cobalt-zinc-cadmium resistance protein CzcA
MSMLCAALRSDPSSSTASSSFALPSPNTVRGPRVSQIAFVGGILALLLAGETWNVSSLVGLIGLFGIAVQNSLVLVTQTRGLLAEGRPLQEAVREASIGRVRPKLMTAGTATLGLLPLLVLQLHGTEIERPLAVVMIGGLLTSTLFTLLVLPTFYLQVHGWLERRARRTMEAEA